ncbi:MAG: DegV family EDD domain-containing protein [Ruminococcaceae bacterium]|nr:DegV family EDD domain-containing protein [Oscillospiraceae bacterium]
MRTVKIVADSSANLMELKSVAFAAAPLKIITAQQEFVDDRELDLDGMIRFFRSYKGKSQTSCPNPEDWLAAFGNAQDVFCVTITSGLSGSYGTACIARDMYQAEHPDRRVFVIDSLSAGPELTLIVEKLEQLIGEGKSFEEICTYIPQYQKKTGLLFMLESLNNFAANGRVSPAVARIAGVLGIRIVGKASNMGTLEPTDKCRGEVKSLHAILKHLKESGLKNGKVQLAHCLNENAANTLKSMIEKELPGAVVKVGKNLGLCSYYAEKGGLLVGFEKE